MKHLLYLVIALFLLLGSASITYSGSINEGFEGATFPPTGWTTVSNGGTPVWTRTLTYPYLGVAVGQINYGSLNTLNLDWLVTPRIGSITASDSLVFYMSRYWQSTNLTWDSTLIMVPRLTRILTALPQSLSWV